MARRKKSFLDDVVVAPWWVGVALAIASLLAAQYLLPAIEIQNPFLKGMQSALPKFALILAVIFLICSAMSAYNSWRRGNLFDRQTDIRSIRLIGWQQFEELVGEAYRRRGFQVTATGGAGADGGVDLVIQKDGTTLLVQCKHWRVEQVGVKVVRELYGVVAAQGAAGGIVISSGTFTPEALDFALGKQLELVDGPGLVRMITELRNTRTPEVLMAAGGPGDNQCPLCGRDMVLRTAQQGPSAGTRFWGCSTFPACRGTKPYRS